VQEPVEHHEDEFVLRWSNFVQGASRAPDVGCKFAHADACKSFIDEESFERIEHFAMP
jgi:hypothetical protein